MRLRRGSKVQSATRVQEVLSPFRYESGKSSSLP